MPDITLWRGNDDPRVVWQCLLNEVEDNAEPAADDIFVLTGSKVFLTIGRIGAQSMVAVNSDDDISLETEDELGVVWWQPTIVESQVLPPGRVARYRLERELDGRRGNLASGYVVVTEGFGPPIHTDRAGSLLLPIAKDDSIVTFVPADRVTRVVVALEGASSVSDDGAILLLL